LDEVLDIAVIGAGSWGTAIGNLLATKGHAVTLWARDKELVANISQQHRNAKYLGDLQLSLRLLATNSFLDLAKKKIFFVAVPSFALREILEQLCNTLEGSARESIWISLTKGIEYRESGDEIKTISQIMSDVLKTDRIFSLTGPSFAAEVVAGAPTTVVLAGKQMDLAKTLQDAFITDRFRIYTSDDLLGVELGGTIKNIIALAAGISDGLGFGDNAKGALISRGLVEMTRLGVHLGAQKDTFFGLTGLGDMVITAMSTQSRNHSVGQRVGSGESLADILDSMDMVAEGVHAVKAIYHYASDNALDLPITKGVYQVLYEVENPIQILTELMSREPKHEAI
jgi:glycerol-3-phosphate dehydrogenase (NAD(P)+)